MAQQNIAEYHQVLQEALPHLLRVIQDPKCRECVPTMILLFNYARFANAPFRCSFGNEDATENAVSAMLKICIVPELGMPEANYMPGILSMLPFTNDMEETDFVYSHLSTQLQQHLSTCAVWSLVWGFAHPT
jgi:hypothetical protein